MSPGVRMAPGSGDGSMVFLVLIMRLLAKGRRERYSRCGMKAGS